MSTTPRTDEVYNRQFAPEKPGITWYELSKQLETKLAAMTARAEKAEADTARLDWLQSSINLHVNSIALRGDIRDAIDKTMKEASK
jgi:hypothetical protein